MDILALRRVCLYPFSVFHPPFRWTGSLRYSSVIRLLFTYHPRLFRLSLLFPPVSQPTLPATFNPFSQTPLYYSCSFPDVNPPPSPHLGIFHSCIIYSPLLLTTIFIPGAPFSCTAGGLCGFEPLNSAVGCCGATDALNPGSLTDCTFQTTCYGASEVAANTDVGEDELALLWFVSLFRLFPLPIRPLRFSWTYLPWRRQIRIRLSLGTEEKAKGISFLLPSQKPFRIFQIYSLASPIFFLLSSSSFFAFPLMLWLN